MIIIETWDEAILGQMTKDAIEGTLEHPTWYRVSEYRYPAGTQHSGRTRQGRVFVLSGGCRYTLPDGSTTFLTAGDIATFPHDDYDFVVEGDDDFEAVMVWKLPPEFRGE